MSLSCEINKEEFNAGDTISLKVGLSIEDEKKGEEIAGGFLKLIIKGEEFASVYTTDHAVQGHFDRIAHPLFTVDTNLDEFDDGGMEKGFYEYHFEHVLAESLPSSFYVRNVKGYCEIRYLVLIILKKPRGSGKDQVFELPFDVRAMPQVPLIGQETNLLQPVISTDFVL